MRRIISWLQQLLKLILSFPRKRAILIGSPEHGNLGDHAISIAERIFFDTNNIRCIEIAGGLYRKFPRIVKFLIKGKDVVCINGGGFLGSLWKLEDNMVNEIIVKFKRNRIVIFPQTIYFTNDYDRNKFVDVYSSHKDLHLFLREKNSYELAKSILNDTVCKIYLAPDMVLTLNTKDIMTQRANTILLCMRSDKESVLHEDTLKAIDNLATAFNADTKRITTNTPGRKILFSEREMALRELLKEIKSSKLLIADRLHAMIFAYITGTPCYVFDNLSHKVSGVYEWIKDCGYIKYCDSSDFNKNNCLLSPGTPKCFDNEFQKLVAVIKGK